MAWQATFSGGEMVKIENYLKEEIISGKDTLKAEEPSNILYDSSTNTLYLDSLTLKQKIAQMIVAYENEDKKVLQDMFIGGIHLKTKANKSEYIETINGLQNGAIIPFFFTVDLEGCSNPFENFQIFSDARDIKNKEEAYQLGYEHGKLLKEMGFGINFAPVVDLEDNIWNCRNFNGNPDEISEKADSYIDGLQANGIIATAKHYPGKTLIVRDPHKYLVYATIEERDMLPFDKAIGDNVSAIMISHLIVNGSLDSQLKPSVTSQDLVDSLKAKFKGLIVTDEINMVGLKNYYGDDIDRMFVDVFKANNDLILDFDRDPKQINRMISVVEKAVRNNDISKERIDHSVVKILNAKGINVKRGFK